MSVIWLEVGIIFLLIILNGFLALSELALVSARKSRLEQLARDGRKGAKIALKLAESPDDFLSTIQIGITFIGILAGAFAGATLADWLTAFFAKLRFIAPYAESLSVALVVMGVTFFSIIFGELVPKRFALNNPEPLACLTAPVILRLSRLTRPLVSLFSGTTNLLLSLFRFRPADPSTVTEEEIRGLLHQGTESGAIKEFEKKTIERVFRLADRRVAVLMTPRAEIVWLNLDDSLENLRSRISARPFSQYPVAQGSLDKITGVILGKDLLALLLQGAPFNLEKAAQKPLFVLDSTPAIQVIDLLKNRDASLAIVIDEYSAVLGLVTLQDILLSVIEDTGPSPGGQPGIRPSGNNLWTVSGSLPLDEFLEFMKIKSNPEEDGGAMNTLSGFIMARLGTIPVRGSVVDWNELRFEVLQMDSRRVELVAVSKIELPADPPAG